MPNNNHPIAPKIRRLSKELRANQTAAEQKLWSVLRNRNLDGIKFRRQHPMDHYVVDFYCLEKKLVIEIDGNSHGSQEVYDARRTAWLEAQGCMVIRFSNAQVMRQLDDVAREIVRVCMELG